MTGESPAPLAFEAHVELLQRFLAGRDRIAASIEELLNAKDRPVAWQENRPLLARHIEDCFFGLAATSSAQAALRGQLRQAHRARGFVPSQIPGVANDIVDPGEMALRAFTLWRQTRWPGRNARLRYAHTLFNLYLLQCLELLAMRSWDAGAQASHGRLAQLQGLLDQLWQGTPADQPVLLRDARWLIALAQSPANEGLAPYVEAAEQIAASFSGPDLVEIHRAAVVLAGGHLRSQLRHYQLARGESLTDRSLILRSRRSNALDFSTLIQSLVSLLHSYGQAVQAQDGSARLALAGAICQGLSPDPELFVNRLDLLGAYSMIEHLYVAAGPDGHAGYTAAGQRHVGLLQQYAALIDNLSASLHEDCLGFRPVAGHASPLGLMYGFSNNLLEHMAAKTLQAGTETRFSLEDAFSVAGNGAEKLAWVSGWRKLPHISPEVQKLYEYPQQFAEQMHERIEAALRPGAGNAGAADRSGSGRLHIPDADDAAAQARCAGIEDLPVQYLASSDPDFLARHGAEAWDEARLLHDRNEGELALSYRTGGGWVAITKDFLTDVLGAGRSAKIGFLPRQAAGILRLMCRGLVAD